MVAVLCVGASAAAYAQQSPRRHLAVDTTANRHLSGDDTASRRPPAHDVTWSLAAASDTPDSPASAGVTWVPVNPSETEPPAAPCVLGPKLVPTCGMLTGVSPAAHTSQPRERAMREFEQKTGRPHQLFHYYHRGAELFPTAWEIALAREPGRERLLFLNWKPQTISWARVAAGEFDPTIDRLAAYITKNFPETFFLSIHHEPEDDVDPRPGSGMTAKDYAAMYRHVIERLRAKGVTNAVTVLCYMGYIPWIVQPWFKDLYPGDDIIDWVGWDVYAYSDLGFGYGDFVELVNRTRAATPSWPGIYEWATRTFPNKPLMLAEWGVWQSDGNPGHKPWFFHTAGDQLKLFPRMKAMVYFDSPNAEGRDSRVDVTPESLQAYRELMRNPVFDVRIR